MQASDVLVMDAFDPLASLPLHALSSTAQDFHSVLHDHSDQVPDFDTDPFAKYAILYLNDVWIGHLPSNPVWLTF